MYKSLGSYLLIALFVVLFFIVGVIPFQLVDLQIPLITVGVVTLLLCLISIFASYLGPYKVDSILIAIFAFGVFFMLGMITSSLVTYSPYENSSLPYYSYVQQIFLEKDLSLLNTILLLSFSGLMIIMSLIVRSILKISTVTLEKIIPVLEIDVNKDSSGYIKKILGREYRFVGSKPFLINALSVFILLYAIFAIVFVIFVFNLTLGLFLQSSIESPFYNLLGTIPHAITYTTLAILISYIFIILSATGIFFSNFRRYAVNIKKLQSVNAVSSVVYFSYGGVLILGISTLMFFLNDKIFFLFPTILVFMSFYSLVIHRVSKEILLLLTQYEANIRSRQIAKGLLLHKNDQGSNSEKLDLEKGKYSSYEAVRENRIDRTDRTDRTDRIEKVEKKEKVAIVNEGYPIYEEANDSAHYNNNAKPNNNCVTLENMESIDLFISPEFFQTVLADINNINEKIPSYMQKKCGVNIPNINLIKRVFYEDISYQLRINKDVILEGKLFLDHLLVNTPENNSIFGGFPGELVIDPVYQTPGKWCPESYKTELENRKMSFQTPLEVVRDHASKAIEARLHVYIDNALMLSIIKSIKEKNRRLASTVKRRFGVSGLVYIYQKLLVERVPINEHRRIFTYLAGTHETQFRNIVNGLYNTFFEDIRGRLRNKDGAVDVARLSQSLITFLSESIDRGNDERALIIDLGNEYKIVLAIFNYSRRAILRGSPIIIVVPSTIRYEFLNFIRRFYMPEIIVLSEKEIGNIEDIKYKEEIDINIY